ncbi:MAG TPA: hypothetical protein VI111_10060 [Thermoleophilaceae bacterium]
MEGSPQDATAQAPVPKATVRTVLISTLTGTIVVGLVFVLLAPPDVPRPRDPSVVEVVLASTTMIAVVRVLVLALGLALLVAVLYVGASAAARLTRHEWLHRAGPFEVELRHDNETPSKPSALDGEQANIKHRASCITDALAQRDRTIAHLAAELARSPSNDPKETQP